MRMRSFALLCTVFLFVFAGAAYAQGTAKTNEWRGLTLGVASTSDAIARLGDPSSDKLGQRYRPLSFEERFDVGEADFRVLQYTGSRGLKGFDKVRLFFRNDVLLAIRLEPKRLMAFALERAYDAEFTFLEDEVSEILIPRDVGRRRGRSSPPRYPMFYYLINESPKSFAIAAVENNSVEEVFGGRGRDSRASRPGRVSKFDLISTKLEFDDGVDLLK